MPASSTHRQGLSSRFDQVVCPSFGSKTTRAVAKDRLKDGLSCHLCFLLQCLPQRPVYLSDSDLDPVSGVHSGKPSSSPR